MVKLDLIFSDSYFLYYCYSIYYKYYNLVYLKLYFKFSMLFLSLLGNVEEKNASHSGYRPPEQSGCSHIGSEAGGQNHAGPPLAEAVKKEGHLP
jgi:hypothetical protein